MKYVLILLYITCLFGCKKNWLEKKPDISLTVPTTLEDFKSLLAGTTRAGSFNVDVGTLVEHGAADFYVTDDAYKNGALIDRNFYSWNKDLWTDPNYGAWSIPYEKILYTNVALEGLEKITPITAGDQRTWNETKGTALFFRAVWHFDVAKQFSKPYNKSTSSSDLGIPLKLSTDINKKSTRSTLEETYSLVINDLKTAAEILPVSTPINTIYKCQPTKAAAYAMLARVFLFMSDYDNAKFYSDKALQLYSTLIKYSTRSMTSNGPFTRFNDEVIFHMTGAVYSLLLNGSLIPIVDSNLYKSYNDNDLRKVLYFRKIDTYKYTFKAGYSGAINSIFAGLATDELYLIRAECNTRKGNVTEGLTDLNTLLETRWMDNGSWVDLSITNANDLLNTILTERRKELCFRALRWMDLKRLNLEQQFHTTLTKTINGSNLTLEPNSPLYVFSIPPNVIELSGIPQNQR